MKAVSTLLEILGKLGREGRSDLQSYHVSTLLEILAELLLSCGADLNVVSTLLEILELMCLVVVGF